MTALPVVERTPLCPRPDGTLDDGQEPARCALTGLGPDDAGDPDLNRAIVERLFDQDCG